MPLGSNVRYRFRRTKGGRAVRLAFRGNTVIEEKPYKKGKGGKLKASGPAKRMQRKRRRKAA